MSRKKRLTAKYTPLSFIDKVIYFVLLLIIIIFLFLAFFWLFDNLPMLYAENQGDIIANQNNPLIFISVLLLVMYVTSVMLCFWIKLYNKKQPFFGNKKYKQKVPTIKTYPLFSGEFKNRPKGPRKKHTTLIILIYIFVFVALSLLYLLGLFNREVITEEYIIEKYNFFNEKIDEKRLESTEKVQIYIYKSSSYKGRDHYYLEIKFTYDDDSYGFSLSSFYGSKEEQLKEIIKLKQRLPKEKIEIDTKSYQKAIDEYDFNEEELALFKQLIELN